MLDNPEKQMETSANLITKRRARRKTAFLPQARRSSVLQPTVVAEEEPPSLGTFLLAVVAQFGFPIAASVLAFNRRSVRWLVRPLGTWWYCVPIYWLLFVADLVTIFMVPKTSAINIAEGSIAVVGSVCMMVAASIAASHDPRASNTQSEGRAHAPYDCELMDEIPPVQNKMAHPLIYFADEWQRPNAAHIADNSEDSFQFNIGEVVVRNDKSPEIVLDFGKDVGVVDEGDPIEICDREWDDEGRPTYMAEGGDPKIMLPLEGLVDFASVAHSRDLIVDCEGLFHGISQKKLARKDLGNGIFATEVPRMRLHIRLLFLILSAVVAFAPLLFRLLYRDGHFGDNTTIEYVHGSLNIVIIFSCMMTLCTVMHNTSRSLANLLNVLNAFNTFSFQSKRNKWHPRLNLLDPVNVQSWYAIGKHMKSVHHVALSQRMLFTAIVGLTGGIAGIYSTVKFAGLEYHKLNGFEAQLLLYSLFTGYYSCSQFLVGSQVNDAGFRSPQAAISLQKVLVDEELSFAGSRSEEDHAILEQLRDVLADISFALLTQNRPIEPAYVPLEQWFTRIALALQTFAIVPFGSVVVGAILNTSDWRRDVQA